MRYTKPAPRLIPTLLVVDDEQDVADIIAEVASGMGFSVRVVNDGARLQEAHDEFQPDAIMLDLKLPGYDGVQLLRLLGAWRSRASVFIVSGMDSRTIAAAGTVGHQNAVKIAGHLSKPLEIKDIEDALRPLLPNRPRFTAEELREAIGLGEIQAYYQPKIDLTDSSALRLAGVEVLARWQRRDGIVVGPDHFLPVLRDAGLMRTMTEAVALDALQQARHWSSLELNFAVSINLDGSTLNDLTLPDKLAGIAADAGVPTERITFEVTESAAMADASVSMDILTRLRLKGFNLSMDDFGTGYSSLVQLYRLPFNELKIDKSFVMDLTHNQEAAIIVETLAMLGRKLGLKVCAEGIEDRETLNRIMACGCHLGQGFLFGRPMPARQILKFAQTWNWEAAGSRE